MLDSFADSVGQGMQKPGGCHSFPKTKSAGGQNDDGPQEIVEVFFIKDASSEEQNHGDDSDHTHVAEDMLELMAATPEGNGGHRDNGDEPLNAGEFVFDGANRDQSGVTAGMEGGQQEAPDQQDGDDADGK